MVKVVSLSLFMALQPFEPWPLFQFLNPICSQQDSLDGGSARRYLQVVVGTTVAVLIIKNRCSEEILSKIKLRHFTEHHFLQRVK
jgi:hypothetical protein